VSPTASISVSRSRHPPEPGDTHAVDRAGRRTARIGRRHPAWPHPRRRVHRHGRDSDQGRAQQTRAKMAQGWHSPLYGEVDEVSFTFSASRGARHIGDELAGFSGTLITDGYGAYVRFAEATAGVTTPNAGRTRGAGFSKPRPATRGPWPRRWSICRPCIAARRRSPIIGSRRPRRCRIAASTPGPSSTPSLPRCTNNDSASIGSTAIRWRRHWLMSIRATGRCGCS